MYILLNKKPVNDVSSLDSRYAGKSICIGVDSSKSNTAISVTSRTYKVLDLIEFNGTEDRDIYELIKEQRKALRIIFSGCKLVDGGIEDIITKKDETSGGQYSESMKHHHSRHMITAVFISIIVLFQDLLDYTLTPISNQSWKAAVLPEELNRRGVYKGSVDYIKAEYPQYITGNKDDDGADAICITKYMKMKAGMSKDSIIEDIPDEVEFNVYMFNYWLVSEDHESQAKGWTQFEYNQSLSLEMNARAISNRLKISGVGWAFVDIELISIEDIYRFCKFQFDEVTNRFILLVKRVG